MFMDEEIFFELASGFWLNVAAAYFVVFVSLDISLSGRSNSFALLVAACFLAYFCRKQLKK